jgi:glutamine amidotransferase
MWGMVSDVSQPGIIQTQLTGFRTFGSTNTNGWAIGYFYNAVEPSPFIWPIIRRGGPPANLDPDYVLAMNEAMQVGTKTLLAHVRIATSGHSGVPDPHPFMEPGWMFCHNGTINQSVLLQLIDPTYLAQHQPDFTNPYIDSELFFIYLMSYVRQAMEINENQSKLGEMMYISVEAAITDAISKLDNALNQSGYSSQLTFLLANGKKIWGCRYADTNPNYYTLYYSWPLPENNWVVASEPFTGDQWTLIPMYNVVTFQAGMRLTYTEIPHH